MMQTDTGPVGAAHVPVMVGEVVAWLRPRPGARLVDATVGLGGHAAALLRAAADTVLLGLDRDPAALAHARARLAPWGARVRLRHASFADLPAVLADEGWPPADAVLLDLGLGSFQLDAPERGFAFRADGPLDMRMDPAAPLDAATIVNTWPERELARVIAAYGEEPRARAIARAIVRARPLASTAALARVVVDVLGPGRGGRHPATRTFQAIRIAVNDELGALDRFLACGWSSAYEPRGDARPAGSHGAPAARATGRRAAPAAARDAPPLRAPRPRARGRVARPLHAQGLAPARGREPRLRALGRARDAAPPRARAPRARGRGRDAARPPPPGGDRAQAPRAHRPAPGPDRGARVGRPCSAGDRGGWPRWPRSSACSSPSSSRGRSTWRCSAGPSSPGGPRASIGRASRLSRDAGRSSIAAARSSRSRSTSRRSTSGRASSVPYAARRRSCLRSRAPSICRCGGYGPRRAAARRSSGSSGRRCPGRPTPPGRSGCAAWGPCSRRGASTRTARSPPTCSASSASTPRGSRGSSGSSTA